MEAVTGLSIMDVVPWAVAGVTLIALVFALRRLRLHRHIKEFAIIDSIGQLSEATAKLRDGLSEAAADEVTSHMRNLLDAVAVGVTDSAGRLLSWDGGANEHYADLEKVIAAALAEERRQMLSHSEVLLCPTRGACGMQHAAVVPVLIEGKVAATLIVVGKTQIKLGEMGDSIAQYVAAHLEAAQLEKSRAQLQQAEIKALRAQISPHFVYNALNTISSHISSDPEQARELLEDFADFTRYCFRADGYFTSLSEELRNIDRYLSIESARYQERLNVRLKIAPEVLPVVVPFLLIQPLVENAVQHGLANKPGGGTVTVLAEDAGTEAVISVEDDGIGMDPKLVNQMRDASTSEHIGLTGVDRRLRQVFAGEYGLVVDTAPDAGTKVTMRIPKFARGVRPELSEAAKAAREQAKKQLQQSSTPQQPRAG